MLTKRQKEKVLAYKRKLNRILNDAKHGRIRSETRFWTYVGEVSDHIKVCNLLLSNRLNATAYKYALLGEVSREMMPSTIDKILTLQPL